MHPLFDGNCPKCKSELPGEKSYKGRHICARAQGSVAPVASPPPGREDGSDGGNGLASDEEVEAQRVLHALDQEMEEIKASKASKLARLEELQHEIGEMSGETAKIFQRLREKSQVDSQFGDILSAMITMLLKQSQSARKRR
jgi:uncharacterized protein YjhX (UPF0386 family)